MSDATPDRVIAHEVQVTINRDQLRWLKISLILVPSGIPRTDGIREWLAYCDRMIQAREAELNA